MPARDDPARVRRYLVRVFETSFDEGPQKLMALRAKFLGLKHVASDTSGDDHAEAMKRREQAEKQLRVLRRSFWTMDLNELGGRLKGIDCSGFPDLNDAVNKLRRTAKHRKLFPQLVQHEGFHSDLFQAFKQVVILSPKEAAPIKEKIVLKARRSNKLKKFRLMIAAVRADFPELYQLEADWFDLIDAG